MTRPTLLLTFVSGVQVRLKEVTKSFPNTLDMNTPVLVRTLVVTVVV